MELLLSTAAYYEQVQPHLESMEGRRDVNSVCNKQDEKGREPVKRAYYRCGKVGHFGRDSECSAKGKTCHKCGGADHFGCSVERKQPNLPSLDEERRQRERKRKKGQSGMWKVKEMRMSMHSL